LAALAALGAVACGGLSGGAPREPVARGTAVAGRLPLVDGGDLELSSLRGRFVVIHVFATWSLDAAADVDELKAARAAVGPTRLTIVGVALDPQGYTLVAPWRAAAGVDWPIVLATAEVTSGDSALGDVMAAVPMTVLVDPDGRVVWSVRGPLPRGELSRHVKVD
jgi:hypothetical protein